MKRYQYTFNELRLPVLSLEYELQAYERLGRKEKAHMIRNYLEGNSGD